MSYDSLTNRGDYLSPHYLAEVLPRELAKKDGLRAQWAQRDKEGNPSPVRELRALKRGYFAARPDLADFAQRAADGDPVTEDERRTHDKAVKKQNDDVLRALGFAAARGVMDVERSGETFGVPVAYQGQNVVAVDCGWAADTDAALDPDRAGRLLDPVETGSNERITTGAKLVRWLFDTDEPPRYVLLLHGGVIILADRLTWAEGRYLAVSLDTAIDRADQPELETIAALFSADVAAAARRGRQRAARPLGGRVPQARRRGVRRAPRGPARVGADHRQRGPRPDPRPTAWRPGTSRNPATWPGSWAGSRCGTCTGSCSCCTPRPARSSASSPPTTRTTSPGYTMHRLGDLVARRLIGEEARTGFHLYESLDLLFRMVNDGHRARGNASTADGLSEGEGLRFEPLKADLFEPSKTRLIGRIPDPRSDDEDSPARHPAAGRGPVQGAAPADALQGQRRGKGKNQRGGFISYAQLGINQLGAVYEGLMSYTGFIAAEELYEVAKNGDPSGGSWMIPASKVPDYADDVFVKEKDENGFPTGERVRYRPGSFVYRLAGRDRQTSASYYTPQSLTSRHRPARPRAAGQGAGRHRHRRRGAPLAGLRARARLRRVPQRGHRPARRPVPAAARGRDRRPARTRGARPRPAAGQGLHRPAQLLRRRPERDRRRARRGLDLAQRHAPRPAGPLVRPAPGPRQLPHRRGPPPVPGARADQGGVAGHRAGGPPVLGGHRSRPATSTTSCSRPRAGARSRTRRRPSSSPPTRRSNSALAQAAPQAPVGQEVPRPQAHPGPAPAGPVGPRRVPVVPGHRAPAHLRTRDQPHHRRLGRGRPARRPSRRSPATRSSPT